MSVSHSPQRGMDSTKRKRAAKACNYCRKRKRKCDGRQPVCTLCEEANNSECAYRDEGNESKRIAISVDRVDEIFDRLESLESTFQSAIARQREKSPVPTPYSIPRPVEAISPEDGIIPASSVHSTGPGTQTSLSQFANNNVFNTTMDIPLSHSSTTGNLLRSAPAKALLGHYPPDLFLHIELRRPVPEGLRLNATPASQIDIPLVSPNETDHLVRNYFQLVHRFHPILDQRAFYELYDRVLDRGPQPDLPSALVLVVLALGTVAAETPNRMDACWSPGIRFFTPAVRLLLTESLGSFGGDPLLPQALYLAALYYSYLSRPLLAWRLVHMASTDVQHYWIRSEKLLRDGQGGSQDQSILRVFWAILVLECDILAEHHLPRSGIEKIVDKLPYPWSDGPSEPYMHRWLADLSSRRLLNRIHYVLYAEAEPGTGDPADSSEETLSSLPNLAHELNRQLGAWYHLLPHSIRPNLDSPPIGIDDTMVSIRYHTTGDIIYRPFLYQVCALAPGTSPNPATLENARQCLLHCRRYLNAVEHAVHAPTASLENLLHGTMAVVLLLSFAAFSRLDALRVPDLNQLQDKGIRICERWAFPGSSIEQMVVILRALRAKCIDTGG
ncbi:unnamed protein product [Fusarium graminearum]|uniref:Chromosome 4, complete genome n=1 Tax=Gibberella zeae (strain ATCC MYA-4620 / CBS 123657 / FGSC 9075 / NRRL 31084 / PH-1) TaxID=229533 RepID=A0A0E0S9S1_GIBZE|nr:hypothetical protein FG05_07591 [Fusarium graminearum]CAG1983959.1 unnamed protein product [Fusarium graminearum]CAG1991562.1 unnamed protein product [Fusarium graminearum]CEF83184.1 unnamed protein product [Fusarium graminearum]CZS73496.1 unnamed protein product [Fusarium graminearum]